MEKAEVKKKAIKKKAVKKPLKVDVESKNVVDKPLEVENKPLSNSSFDWSTLVGPDLISGSGKYVNHQSSALNGKHVGLYFSAHWCPPCRRFTPKLADFFSGKKYGAHNLDIVFVSSDQSQSQFDEYFGEMPWKAIPYSASAIRRKLSQKCRVEGIPTLAIFSPDGALLTTSGVQAVYENDLDVLFPKPLWERLADVQVYDNKNASHSLKELSQNNDVTAIYFSAHWCPPCRMFTPQLVKAYNKLKQDGKKFEVIFASSDRKEAEYKEYLESMPWKSFGFKSKYTEGLSQHFNVEGIPTLVLLNNKGETIVSNGRAHVTEDLEGFPWFGSSSQPIRKLSGVSAEVINEGPTFIAVVDGKDEAKYFDLLKPIASEYVERGAAINDEPLSFILAGSSHLTGRITEFLNVHPPSMIITNLPEGEKWLPTKQEITTASVKAFVDAYLAGGKGLKKLSPRE